MIHIDIAKRLVQIREQNGYSRKRLAEELGRPYRTLTNYESGVREPGHEYIIEIAKKFGVTTDFILGISDNPKISTKNASPYSSEAQELAEVYEKLDDRGKRVVRAVLECESKIAPMGSTDRMPNESSKVTAKPWIKRRRGFTQIEVFDEPAAAGLGNPIDTPPSRTEQYPSEYVPSKADFGVLISGESMEPKIPNEAIVFVQATPILDIGEVGIFVLDGKSYCKQLKRDPETHQVKLHSINPDYTDIDVPPFAELHALGRVVGCYIPKSK